MLTCLVFDNTNYQINLKNIVIVNRIQLLFYWITNTSDHFCRLSVLSAITSVQQRLKLYSKGVFVCFNVCVQSSTLICIDLAFTKHLQLRQVKRTPLDYINELII